MDVHSVCMHVGQGWSAVLQLKDSVVGQVGRYMALTWQVAIANAGGEEVQGAPVVLAHYAPQDAKGDGDQGPDDQDDQDGTKGQRLCGLHQPQPAVD